MAVIGADAANGTWEYSTDSGGLGRSRRRVIGHRAPAGLGRHESVEVGPQRELLRFCDAHAPRVGPDIGRGRLDGNARSNGGRRLQHGHRTASIAVQPVNDAPAFVVGTDQTVAEDAAPRRWWAGPPASALDGEQGRPDCSLQRDRQYSPGLFAVAPAVDTTGTLAYTPAPNANGSATVTLVLADNGGTASGGQDTSGPQSFTITVDPVNDAPTCSDDSNVTPEDTQLSDAVTCTDVDGDPLTVAEGSGPTNGTLTLDPDGSFTYDPDPDFNGVDSFTFTASDGSLDSAEATFTITWGRPGQRRADLQRRQRRHPRGHPAQRCRHLHRCRRRSADRRRGLGPTNGTLTLDPDGSFTYDPDPDFNGVDSFTFTASGGSLDSAEATFTITVSGRTTHPSSTRSARGRLRGSALTFTVTASDVDLPPDR